VPVELHPVRCWRSQEIGTSKRNSLSNDALLQHLMCLMTFLSSSVQAVQELLVRNWVTHVVIFQFSLELAAGMHALMKQSKQSFEHMHLLQFTLL
jgi:hypothetical protein